MVKIAFIGDRESIKGYAAVGINIFPCEDADSAREQLKTLCSGEYGIIYITEEYAALLSEEIAKFDEKMLPAIIPLPGVKNNNGIGISRLKASVEKAVGSDIIFGK
ncbi:MAG: V-type ATP synthase subunit F [Acutalibacteraceae bacterium]|nr:V-type ATP synthase subunit F [Acutalibacteraceae bacterium]